TGCTYSDLSAGQGYGSGYSPAALIDTAAAKLLVVTENGANSFKPALFRCNLDGSGCVYSDISAGQGANSGYYPSAMIDTAGSKLLVVTANGANSFKPALFRCNLDGSGCAYSDISVGQGANSGYYPSLVIDSPTAKLLAATGNYA